MQCVFCITVLTARLVRAVFLWASSFQDRHLSPAGRACDNGASEITRSPTMFSDALHFILNIVFSLFGIALIIRAWIRSEEHTSELQSLMRISYAVFCLKKKKKQNYIHKINKPHHDRHRHQT